MLKTSRENKAGKADVKEADETKEYTFKTVKGSVVSLSGEEEGPGHD